MFKWLFGGDDDGDIEFWVRGQEGEKQEVVEVSRSEQGLPPLYTYTTEQFANGEVPGTQPPDSDAA